MPRPDPTENMRISRSGLRMRDLLRFLHRRRRRGKDPDGGGVPVEPNRPNTLSGGAAAPLEFDD